jgi:hypothetical protein
MADVSSESDEEAGEKRRREIYKGRDVSTGSNKLVEYQIGKLTGGCVRFPAYLLARDEACWGRAAVTRALWRCGVGVERAAFRRISRDSGCDVSHKSLG